MAKKRYDMPAPARPVEAAPDPQVTWWRKILREPVALGLVLVIVLRPWLDGVTYPTDNYYFVWWVMVLFALWAVRLMLRGEPIRFTVPIVLLTGFLAVAALTTVTTVQFYATYRTFILWAGHVALFILVTNGLRSKTAVGIVLVAFVTTSLAESAWSLIHFKIVLPYVRQSIIENPSLLKTYFGKSELDPEIAHRLAVNRAFGSLLFPNALAAFVLAGIPLAALGTVHGVRALLDALRAVKSGAAGRTGDTLSRTRDSRATLITGGAVWLAVICLSCFLFSFIGEFTFPLPQGTARVSFLPVVHSTTDGYYADSAAYLLLWFFFVVILPLAVAAIAARVAWRYGVRTFALALRVWTLPPLLVLQLAALWLTYSRGGWIALAAAIVISAPLFLVGRLWTTRLRQMSGAAAVALLIAGVSLAHAQPAPTPEPPAAQAPPAAQPSPAPAQPAAPPLEATSHQLDLMKQIPKEGVNLSVDDLMNPASFRLRLTYWRTALTMAKANFWLGVGLGNFGTVYPKYQRPGAGDVKTTHNDYLQALCETGVFGCLFFCAFWAYFVLWGARRLLDEQDAQERWVLGGLYVGVLAFLIHSVVEFNFFNPSLAFFVFLLAGTFFARATLGTPSGAPRTAYKVLALPMLVVAALVVGMAARTYITDFIVGGHKWINVGNLRELNALYDSGDFFVRGFNTAARVGKQPARDIITVSRVFSDRDELEKVANIRVPLDETRTKFRALRADEPVPPNAIVIFTKPQEAQKRALALIDDLLGNLAVADRFFPYNPELAAYFIRWYDLLASFIADPELKRQYTAQLVKWSRMGVERTPEQAVYREWLAKALWLWGNLDTGPNRHQNFENGLAEYKKASDLYPSSSYLMRRYGDALIKYGEALKAMDRKFQGDQRINEGNEAMRRADELDKFAPPT